MPWFLFKAHVIFLIFQNICNKSLDFLKNMIKSSYLSKIWEPNIVRIAFEIIILQKLTYNTWCHHTVSLYSYII